MKWYKQIELAYDEWIKRYEVHSRDFDYIPIKLSNNWVRYIKRKDVVKYIRERKQEMYANRWAKSRKKQLDWILWR